MPQWLLCVVATVVVASVVQTQPTVARTSATPVDPIAGIIDAFRTRTVVALGEGGHGNEQAHRFRLALVRDARFAAVVNDIVVESGSARYQEVMDRFVGGGDVPRDVLVRAWRDTTQPTEIWDLPIYEELFRVVREVNTSLPRERRIRVLLGDPPVQWEAVQTIRDLDRWGSRDSHAAEVIQREVLSRNRRALIVYGDDHLAKKSRALGAGDEWPTNVVGLLEKAGTPMFVVHAETRMNLQAIQPDIGSWPNPSFARLNNTVLGGADYESSPRLRPRRMEELFDAVLYLGPPSGITFARLDPALCSDQAYVRMRLARLSLLPGPPTQAPPGTLAPADHFKQDCAGKAK
jgi:hypothetical protein